MTSVQIKDVPEETHRVLRRRAAEAHQSLQEYLRTWLIAETARPTLDEVVGDAARDVRARVGFDTVNALIRADRDRR